MPEATVQPQENKSGLEKTMKEGIKSEKKNIKCDGAPTISPSTSDNENPKENNAQPFSRRLEGESVSSQTNKKEKNAELYSKDDVTKLPKSEPVSSETDAKEKNAEINSTDDVTKLPKSEPVSSETDANEKNVQLHSRDDVIKLPKSEPVSSLTDANEPKEHFPLDSIPVELKSPEAYERPGVIPDKPAVQPKQTKVPVDLKCQCGQIIATYDDIFNKISTFEPTPSKRYMPSPYCPDILTQHFTNPHGYEFDVLTTKRANLNVDNKAYKFCQFYPDFQWKISYCPRCEKHLGWLYEPEDAKTGQEPSVDPFYGLLLSKLDIPQA